MRAVTMVAHPDDCVIFAYSFMHAYPDIDWTVCYLTYTESDSRGQEFAEFWRRRNVVTQFLGYVDDWHDIENKTISFDTIAAADSIKQVIKDYDLVLTHDQQGDYGHLHHQFINGVVCENHSHVICFAGPGRGNVKYSVPAGAYSLDEFPQHRDVVSGFHQNGHVNEYTVTQQVNNIL